MKSKILILSGAGLSAESGISTFRGTNGLWKNYNVMEVCSEAGFYNDRQKVLDFYDLRREDITDKVPNDAHYMIARVKEKYPDKVYVLTQNVDDLLEKAGCKNVVHLHGKLRELLCEDCTETFDIGYDPILKHKKCPACGSSLLRHNVVMFGEPAPEYETLYETLHETALLVVIGTSGRVLQINEFAHKTKYSILNNLEPDKAIKARLFTKVFYKKASSAAPVIESLVDQYVDNGYI